MKRTISILLSLIFLFPASTPLAAASYSEVQTAPADTMYGILRDENGTEYQIKGVLVSSAENQVARNGSAFTAMSATYAYAIPAQPRAGYSQTIYDNDGAIASTVYLTVHYTRELNLPAADNYLLTAVSGHWELGNSMTSVTGAELDYECTSITHTHQDVNNVPVVNNFWIDSYFTTPVAPGIRTKLGAELTVHYLMGTSRRWSFTLGNAVLEG